MDLIERYQKQGFSFFPLRKRSKKPIFEWTGWQTRRPSPEEVKTWQDQGLLNQVAVVCGAISGIIVLDVDDPTVFDAWIASQKHPMPPSPTVKTGKGWHIYFRHPGGKIKNSTRQIPGADIKADGGYVVAPPSIHPKGPVYEWVFALGLDDVDLADPPAWLTDYFEREVSATVELSKEDLLGEDEDKWAILLQGVKDGQRNDATGQLAGYFLGRGDPESRVRQILILWNRQNIPPLPEKTIVGHVSRLARKEAQKQVRQGVAQGQDGKSTVNLPWDEQREAQIQGLGDLLALPITDIRSIKGDDSVWEIVLGADGPVMINAQQLTSQSLFRTRFVQVAHLLPKNIHTPKGKQSKWDQVVREIMSLAINLEAGPDASSLGEIQGLINGYLLEYRGVEYISRDKKVPTGAPFFIPRRENEPRIYARLDSLTAQAKYNNYNLSRKKISNLLPSLGHEWEEFRWAGATVRGWRLNLEQLPQEIKDHVYKKNIEAVSEDNPDDRVQSGNQSGHN